MMKVDAIRACLEGVIPGIMATAALDGTPNVAYLSQVQFVDSDHVALSYQFFNKTRQNLMANPHAMLTVADPHTMVQYRLTLEYLRTETAGPLFESMKAKLAGIASHTGMSGVFRLLGSDVFRVDAIEQVPGECLPAVAPARNLLAALRASSEKLMACPDLDCLLAATLDCLARQFGISHAMVLMPDRASQRLYTVASCGYPDSGAGSEIVMGDGVIGVAARERTPIRIGHMTSEYAYSRAIRDNTVDSEFATALETRIPFPGLAQPRSQMAVPALAGDRLQGMLYVESEQDLRFGYDDEDALVALASQLGLAIALLQGAADHAADAADGAGRTLAQHATDANQIAVECVPATTHTAMAATSRLPATAAPLLVRHFSANDSLFLGDDYLIKGVAGSIFWTLLCDYSDKQRTDFTNRELRLDHRIRLPDVSDNLEARLILLSRRLADRNAPMRIVKTGRGRFRLSVDCPIQLADIQR